MATQPATPQQTRHTVGWMLMALATTALILFYVIIAGRATAGSVHFGLGVLAAAGLMGGLGTWLVCSQLNGQSRT